MNSSIIKRLVEDELARGESFRNFHGITSENVRSFLVEPFQVRTHPDDLVETEPRDMWVVLQEYPVPTQGYVVVYDPQEKTWGIAENTGGDNYVMIGGGDKSLADAIIGM